MLFDFLFPRVCVGCSRELRSGALCNDCARTLPNTETPRCPHCARRVPRGVLTRECRGALRVARIASGLPYAHPMVRAAIDALKYESIRELADPLGERLAAQLRTIFDDPPPLPPLLLAVPLYDRRLRARGFNQSALLAQRAARQLRLPYAEGALVRVRETEQQAKLERAQREKNVYDAFLARAHPRLTTSTVILIDDVATTGATLREAARALRRAGAREVWAATAAHG